MAMSSTNPSIEITEVPRVLAINTHHTTHTDEYHALVSARHVNILRKKCRPQQGRYQESGDSTVLASLTVRCRRRRFVSLYLRSLPLHLLTALSGCPTVGCATRTWLTAGLRGCMGSTELAGTSLQLLLWPSLIYCCFVVVWVFFKWHKNWLLKGYPKGVSISADWLSWACPTSFWKENFQHFQWMLDYYPGMTLAPMLN